MFNELITSIYGTAATTVSAAQFAASFGVSLLLGILIAAAYMYNTRYTKSFAVTLAILPAGGFVTLGLLLALINRLGEWRARRRGAPPPLPVNLDCRHCTMCGNGKAEGRP